MKKMDSTVQKRKYLILDMPYRFEDEAAWKDAITVVSQMAVNDYAIVVRIDDLQDAFLLGRAFSDHVACREDYYLAACDPSLGRPAMHAFCVLRPSHDVTPFKRQRYFITAKDLLVQGPLWGQQAYNRCLFEEIIEPNSQVLKYHFFQAKLKP